MGIIGLCVQSGVQSGVQSDVVTKATNMCVYSQFYNSVPFTCTLEKGRKL